jgi:hypothetical protein
MHDAPNVPSRRTPILKSLWRASSVLLPCLLLGALPVHAGNITALAAQNLIGSDEQTSSVDVEVSASFGQASARASRVQVSAFANGAGAGPQTAFQSSAGSTSTYSLWDIGRNLPVAPADAMEMELDFNFELVGSLTVGSSSLSSASTRYVAGLDPSNVIIVNHQSALTVTYGPVPGGLDYIFIGDQSLYGGFVQSFTARHEGALGGAITMVVSNTAFNAGNAHSTLTLASIGLIGGAMPPGGLGVRIDETGLIIPVSPVIPEPAAMLLMRAGLAAVVPAVAWQRRRPS